MSSLAPTQTIRWLALAAAIATVVVTEPSAAKRAVREPELGPLNGSTWQLAEVARGTPHRLASERQLPLLRRFIEPQVERPGEWRGFWQGRYGPSNWLGGRLSWSTTACEPHGEADTEAIRFLGAQHSVESSALLPALSLTAAPLTLTGLSLPSFAAPSALFAPADEQAVVAPAGRCKPWEKPYVATLARYGGEHDTITLLECDGSVAVDALDRLSVIARPPGVPRPDLPLPLEPAADGVGGEWLPEVRLLDPRLVWAVARLSATFPQRVMYVISGYRRTSHDGLHHKGRALDLFITGVANEDLFQACRRMKDVGCGYYPHNRFVHLDVRAPFTGHALWIDASQPGEKTRYVDSWPGVVQSGALNFGNDEN